ncbi:hypothetical protein PBY51_020616 [Eleginops maclovinus]|uniref:Uncharacterized protein n=1 Tax=Eleginops maclovinus TaxID=56733 RepID=A0AAN7XUY0_ELEMC|nr:hypothetical protein PBY51_020616 [Eleginops maclovinus]
MKIMFLKLMKVMTSPVMMLQSRGIRVDLIRVVDVVAVDVVDVYMVAVDVVDVYMVAVDMVAVEAVDVVVLEAVDVGCINNKLTSHQRVTMTLIQEIICHHSPPVVLQEYTLDTFY